MASLSLALQSVVLGIVQGLTEFLPISSSAHLVIVPWLFRWTDPVLSGLTFDVALHFGTLLAVVGFFAADWGRLISAWLGNVVKLQFGEDQDSRMAWFILLATIPGAVAGVFFESAVSTSFHVQPIPRMSMILMALVIAVLGGLLYLADGLGTQTRPFGKIGWADACLVGLSQALAIFPGVSRSGATITAGLALKLDRPSAARFSFLLLAPITAGAVLKSVYDLFNGGHGASFTTAEILAFPLGFVAAAVTGFFCIRVLLSFLQKHSMKAFVFYRWALAALVLVVALTRA